MSYESKVDYSISYEGTYDNKDWNNDGKCYFCHKKINDRKSAFYTEDHYDSSVYVIKYLFCSKECMVANKI